VNKLLWLALSLPGIAAAANPVIWTRGADNSTEEYLDGKLIRTLQDQGLRVSTYLFWTAKDAVAAEVYVINDSNKLVNVLPDQMFISATPANQNAKPAFLGTLPISALIADVNHKAAVSAALSQLAASLQSVTTTTQSTTSGTVNVIGPGGFANGTFNGTTQSTTTSPNWEARRLANYRAMQLYAMAQDRVAAIQATALKANTVHTGGSVGGIVWIGRHKYFSQRGTQLLFNLRLDDRTFEFPYPAK
jgi:hypothetical protein